MSALRRGSVALLLFCRVLRYAGSEPMVEPVCEPALAGQADVPHLQQCPREGRARAPAQEDTDALRQPHLPAHLPLREHRCVQKVSHDGPRGGSRYCERLFLHGLPSTYMGTFKIPLKILFIYLFMPETCIDYLLCARNSLKR